MNKDQGQKAMPSSFSAFSLQPSAFHPIPPAQRRSTLTMPEAKGRREVNPIARPRPRVKSDLPPEDLDEVRTEAPAQALEPRGNGAPAGDEDDFVGFDAETNSRY